MRLNNVDARVISKAERINQLGKRFLWISNEGEAQKIKRKKENIKDPAKNTLKSRLDNPLQQDAIIFCHFIYTVILILVT